MDMKIVNLTPHDVNIVSGDKKSRLACFKSDVKSGEYELPRVRFGRMEDRSVGIIPMSLTYMSGVEHLPPEEDGVLYIVSMLVSAACPDRRDLVSPDNVLREERGKPWACTGFTRSLPRGEAESPSDEGDVRFLTQGSDVARPTYALFDRSLRKGVREEMESNGARKTKGSEVLYCSTR